MRDIQVKLNFIIKPTVKYHELRRIRYSVDLSQSEEQLNPATLR